MDHESESKKLDLDKEGKLEKNGEFSLEIISKKERQEVPKLALFSLVFIIEGFNIVLYS